MKFLVGDFQILSRPLIKGRIARQQVQNVRDSLQGIVNLVRDGCSHSTGNSQPFRIAQRFFCHFGLRDIASYGRCTNHFALRVPYRRNGERHMKNLAIFVATASFEALDLFSPA